MQSGICQILLSGKDDFTFTDVGKIKEFQDRVSDLVFDTISSEPYNLIRNTPAGRAQFDAFISTLYAVNRARMALPDSERSKFMTVNNPRGIFTLTDLARAISSPNVKEESARRLIIQQLSKGLPTLQLGRAIHILQEGSQRARIESDAAIATIRDYVKEESLNALRGGEDWGAIGGLAHDILEAITHEFLVKKGIKVDFEIRLKDVDSQVEGGFIADLLIDAESFLDHVDNPLVREMIPRGVKYIVIDFSLSKSESFFMSKTGKSYQSGDRYLLMVHYGEYKNSMVPNIRTKIAERESLNFKQNVGIITDDVFKDFLGLSDESLSTYDQFQGVMSELFEHRRRSDLEKLISLWDDSQTYLSFLGNKP